MKPRPARPTAVAYSCAWRSACASLPSVAIVDLPVRRSQRRRCRPRGWREPHEAEQRLASRQSRPSAELLASLPHLVLSVQILSVERRPDVKDVLAPLPRQNFLVLGRRPRLSALARQAIRARSRVHRREPHGAAHIERSSVHSDAVRYTPTRARPSDINSGAAAQDPLCFLLATLRTRPRSFRRRSISRLVAICLASDSSARSPLAASRDASGQVLLLRDGRLHCSGCSHRWSAPYTRLAPLDAWSVYCRRSDQRRPDCDVTTS